jgi:hypothetical protein
MAGISIRSRVDLTVARNVLRKRIAGDKYNPTFRARAAAVLTAMAEVVFASNAPGNLDMRMLSQGEKKGIEFHLSLTGGNLEDYYQQFETETSSIVDEVELSSTAQYSRVMARVLLTDQEVR